MYKKFLIGLFSVLSVTVATPTWASKLDLYDCYTKIFKEALNRDIQPYSSTKWNFCSSFKTTYGWTDTQVGICVNGLTGFLEEAYACDSVYSCYIPKDAKNQDEIGTFRFVNNCYYWQ